MNAETLITKVEQESRADFMAWFVTQQENLDTKELVLATRTWIQKGELELARELIESTRSSCGVATPVIEDIYAKILWLDGKYLDALRIVRNAGDRTNDENIKSLESAFFKMLCEKGLHEELHQLEPETTLQFSITDFEVEVADFPTRFAGALREDFRLWLKQKYDGGFGDPTDFHLVSIVKLIRKWFLEGKVSFVQVLIHNLLARDIRHPRVAYFHAMVTRDLETIECALTIAEQAYARWEKSYLKDLTKMFGEMRDAR